MRHCDCRNSVNSIALRSHARSIRRSIFAANLRAGVASREASSRTQKSRQRRAASYFVPLDRVNTLVANSPREAATSIVSRAFCTLQTAPSDNNVQCIIYEGAGRKVEKPCNEACSRYYDNNKKRRGRINGNEQEHRPHSARACSFRIIIDNF